VEFIEAQLQNGETIRYYPQKKIGEGAEKEFFETEDENLVIGFYKDRQGNSDPERIKRLTHIIEKYNPTLDKGRENFWKQHFCWSSAIVIKPYIGVLTPKFPSQYYFSDGKGEKKGKWFLHHGPLQKLNQNDRGDLFNRIQICRHLAMSIGRMHNAGLAHSDLSGNNVLMDPRNGTCMIIDIDSLVVKGVYPSKVLGTRGYIAPEVVKTSRLPLKHPDKKLPNIQTDLHSLAVIFYQMLLLRHPLEGKRIHSENPETDDLMMFGENALFIENPNDDSNRPDNLSPSYYITGDYLVPLFQRAFIDGLHHPDERPTAYEWEKALNYTVDMLYPCQGSECWHKWFICQKGTLLKCPFCEWKPSDKIPVMHLFQKYKAGEYLSENHYIAVWNGKKIYKWHTCSNISYPADISDYAECQGTFRLENNKWILQNESNENIFSASGKRIRLHESEEISDNNILLLNNHSKGRVALFELLS